MFNLSSLQAKKPEEGYRQLSASSDNLHLQDDSVIFSVADDDDDDEERAIGRNHVRFEENVHIIGPPLRSTIESRETGTCRTLVAWRKNI